MVCMQVSSQWPKELEAKQSRLAAVQATLNNGINTEVCAKRSCEPNSVRHLVKITVTY